MDAQSEDSRSCCVAKRCFAEHWLSPLGVTWLGLVINASVGAAKIATGIVCASQTIIADGVHALSDLVTDAAVLTGLRISARPADSDHHYGHRRFGTLVAMFIGAAILATGAYVAYRGAVSLHSPPERIFPLPPLLLAAVSVPIKEGLFRVTRWVGRRKGSAVLLANAWHHRTDAFTSVAATVGLAGVVFGGQEWWFLDAATAMVLSAFLVAAGLKIMFSSGSELMDVAPGKATLAAIEEVVRRTRGVEGYHAFRARQLGGTVAMDIHIQVDPSITVREGHEIAAEVKHDVFALGGVAEVIVHVEPAEREGE